MIYYVKVLEDKVEWQVYIEKIIDMMQMMYLQSCSIEDYCECFWKYVYCIVEYDFDVDYFYGEFFIEEEYCKCFEQVFYLIWEVCYCYYGYNVQEFIKKVKEMLEGFKWDGFVVIIGFYMKLAYCIWNKEYYVSDEVIKFDFKGLFKGELIMDEDENIENFVKGSNNNIINSNNINNNCCCFNNKWFGGGCFRGGCFGGGSFCGGCSNYCCSKCQMILVLFLK